MAQVGDGYFTVYNKIPELIVSVEAQSRSYPKKMADIILQRAKARIHRVTGNLQDTAYTESLQAGRWAVIIFPADYATSVEYGTWKMSARPFLTPAIEQSETEFFTGIFKAPFAAAAL